MSEPLVVRYAKTDDDIIHIHQFLCIVAGLTLPGPIGPKESIEEIWRLTHEDVALMAMNGDALVGTLGLTCPAFWWNHKIRFLVNRFFFTLPGSKAARPLLKEAKAIAKASNVELHILDENRKRYLIFNKNPHRNNHLAADATAGRVKPRVSEIAL